MSPMRVCLCARVCAHPGGVGFLDVGPSPLPHVATGGGRPPLCTRGRPAGVVLVVTSIVAVAVVVIIVVVATTIVQY